MKIDTNEINEVLRTKKPKINLESKVGLAKVRLPEGYKDLALDLIRRSYDEVSVNYGKPAVVAVGLSGGLDSSTALAAAVEAVGKDNTRAVLLRHDYMTDGEKEDAGYADFMINYLGVEADTIDISGLVRAHWDLTGKKDHGPFVNNLLKAEGLARARASALESYSSSEDAITIDTSNMTELVLGNVTTGAYMGMVEIFEDLLKSEVYELARQLGVPARIRDQQKRISEFSSTHEHMFGADFRYLDPLVHRFLKGVTSEQAAKELGHGEEWVKKMYSRMDGTRFRYSAAGPISRMSEFDENEGKDAAWVGGMKTYWKDAQKLKLARELHKLREEYLP
ncbi:NAD(+) synthase [Candidatus Pacearchaeota archaeon]|nr:NAD(+) synthase [Candidatus Pacearchaeota archaeon]